MKNVCITEDTGDVFEHIVDQLFLSNNRARTPGDYLVQMILVEPDQTEKDITVYLRISDSCHAIWGYKWWDGECCIKITALAKIEDIDISQAFPFN